jgi:hypothetical protein
MVREQAFDVCEMAIVTYLMAKAYNKPLVLLPAAMLGPKGTKEFARSPDWRIEADRILAKLKGGK